MSHPVRSPAAGHRCRFGVLLLRCSCRSVCRCRLATLSFTQLRRCTSDGPTAPALTAPPPAGGKLTVPQPPRRRQRHPTASSGSWSASIVKNWPVARRGNLSFFWKPIIFQNFWAMLFKNHSLTSYQNIYSNISFPKAVNKTCPCGVTIFTSHHKVITSSRSLQTRLLHQGVSRLLRHDDVDQSQTV